MAPTPFELRFLPDDRGRPRCFILQLPLRGESVEAPEGIQCLAGLVGPQLQAMRPLIESTLAEVVGGGLDVEAILSSDSTIRLTEGQALRIALGAALIADVRRTDRMHALLGGLATLPQVDALFWLGRLGGEDAARARRALLAYLDETA